MIRLLLLLVATCYLSACAADTLTTNKSSYNTGDPITIVFTTTNQYTEVILEINGVVVQDQVNASNLITGTITYTGFVTCPMGLASDPALPITPTGIPVVGHRQ